MTQERGARKARTMPHTATQGRPRLRTVRRLMAGALRICAVGGAAAVSTATLISPPTVAADPVTVTATVLKVVDGDTIDIRDDVRGRLRVRVLGIDTPE